MKIIFQNEFFVMIDKNSGYLSVPSRFPDRDQRLVAGIELEKQLGQKVFPVHRLDCEVSGILMFALQAEAHKEANSIFEKHQVQKTYQALTSAQAGIQIPEIGKMFTWKAKVLRGKKRSYESPHGKLSVTEAIFQGLHNEKGQYRWTLKPITGRSHQLRFDLSRHGFPIIGDVLYGGNDIGKPEEIQLRACEIEFSNDDFCEKWKLPKQLKVVGLF